MVVDGRVRQSLEHLWNRSNMVIKSVMTESDAHQAIFTVVFCMIMNL